MNTQPGRVHVGPQLSFQVLHREWGWLMALAILLIVLGTAAIIFPVAASFAIATLLGIILVIGGIAHAVHGIMARQWSGFIWQMLTALIYMAAGILLLVYPLTGVVTLTLLLGIFLLIAGSVRIMMSALYRPLRLWGWMLASGVLALVLGVLILVQWPSSSDWVIGLIVGIDLLFSGWSVLALSLAARAAD